MQAVTTNNKRQHDTEEPNSRVERKKPEQSQKVRIRLVPIWARIIIVTLLLCIALISGAMVGYSVMGDGKAMDVFKKSTWTHITDLVNKDTPSQNK